tara:strand:+ start:159 stop:293 length:135 start_codon:yes stop_codon:yes gene_type:complete
MAHQTNNGVAFVTSYSPEPEPQVSEEEKEETTEYQSLEEALTGE